MSRDEGDTGSPAGQTDARLARSRGAVWAVVGLIAAVVVVVVLSFVALSNGGSDGADPTTVASESEPPRTTEASPTPEPGGPVEPTELPVAPIDTPVTPAPGYQVSISGIEAVDGEAEGPGEVAGPAIRFVVEIANSGESAIDLAELVVNVDSGADRAPALDLSGPGRIEMPGTAPVGEQVRGVYVFAIDPSRRDDVRITVDLTPGVPVAVFAGAVPR